MTAWVICTPTRDPNVARDHRTLFELWRELESRGIDDPARVMAMSVYDAMENEYLRNHCGKPVGGEIWDVRR